MSSHESGASSEAEARLFSFLLHFFVHLLLFVLLLYFFVSLLLLFVHLLHFFYQFAASCCLSASFFVHLLLLFALLLHVSVRRLFLFVHLLLTLPAIGLFHLPVSAFFFFVSTDYSTYIYIGLSHLCSALFRHPVHV